MHLTQALHKARRERPQETATIHQDRRQTNAEFVGRVERLAGALRALGLGKGDRAGMLAANSDRYIEFIFATLWAGGAVNPVNTRWSAAEIAYSLDDSGTAILVVDDFGAGLVADVQARCKTQLTLIHVGTGPAPAGAHDYEALIAGTPPAPDAFCGNDDLAAILYTGGTTGAPKGVMLSHRNVLANAIGLTASADHAGAAPGLHVAPMFHVGGLAAAVQFSIRGSTQITQPAFDAGEALEIIERERVGDIFVVPVMLRWLIDHPDMARRDTSSLVAVRYGAAPIDVTLLARAMKALPQAGFLQVYGQTECAAVVTALAPQDHVADPDVPHMRSAGKPIITAELRITDEDGQECPHGTVGELQVRGPTVMLGYWNKPEATEKALVDGWLRTGDAGYMDDQGFVYVVDRMKDMIISGGENVFSTEVENVLATYPGVGLCAVIGVPDDEWGERVHAVVQAAPGQDLSGLTLEALQAHCRAHIAGYKLPRSLEVVDAMPISPAGKILKRDLRIPHWENRERMVG